MRTFVVCVCDMVVSDMDLVWLQSVLSVLSVLLSGAVEGFSTIILCYFYVPVLKR